MADSSERKQKIPIKPVPKNSGWCGVLRELIAKHHHYLQGDKADIVLMWHLSSKADSDGNLKVAWAKKTSELDRQRDADGRDFVIFLNHDIYNRSDFSELQGRFWLDMALESCKPVTKDNGDQKLNEDNEYCWRIAKAPIQVFPEVIARHGPLSEALVTLRQITLDREEIDRPLLRMMGAAVEAEEEDDTEEREDEAVREILEEEDEPVHA